jgi:hypothetical protein
VQIDIQAHGLPSTCLTLPSDMTLALTTGTGVDHAANGPLRGRHNREQIEVKLHPLPDVIIRVLNRIEPVSGDTVEIVRTPVRSAL